MDDIRVKVAKDNLKKSVKIPTHQGKVLVFDIIRKSKPLPFKTHIEITKIPQESLKQELLKKEEFVKIEKKQVKKKYDERRYKITVKKSFLIKNFLISLRFALAAIAIALIVPLSIKVNDAYLVKEFVKDQGEKALSDFAFASSLIADKNFDKAQTSFSNALTKFIEAQNNIKSLGNATLFLIASVPGISEQFTQGEKLIEVAKNLTEMGQIFSSVLEKISLGSKEKITFSSISPLFKNFTQTFSQTEKLLQEINFSSLPEPIKSYEAKINKLIQPFNYLSKFLNSFLPIAESAFGVDHPKKYIFIFQNPSEIRPTGGFIGSYGLLDIDDGIVKNFKIDDVYNIDGQLKVAVVPPNPIQKVSAAWSFHDANWFFDFPTSARKLQWFYEKTGGATTDGVIAVTPSLLEAILKITGPIYLEKYNVTIDKNNFVDILQYKIELDFDKNLMQPKKILSDLGLIIEEKLKNFKVQEFIVLLSDVLDLVDKKDIMFYFENSDLQKFVESQGWSGKIADISGDYLAIVNTNLNGFKTDKVIEQTANVNIFIENNGDVKNSVYLNRKHNGGNSSYDWYNKVNTNYLRFYVPEQSKLLKASGHTIEIIAPRLDYEKNKFKIDPDVQSQESQTKLDSNGFFISKENDKKTFGAWTYVSPQEELKVMIDYLSGAKVDPLNPQYQIYLQKQPGMKKQKTNINIYFPKNWKIAWSFPENLKIQKGFVSYTTNLEYDEIISLNFENN